jgi:hypothetical protein
VPYCCYVSRRVVSCRDHDPTVQSLSCLRLSQLEKMLEIARIESVPHEQAAGEVEWRIYRVLDYWLF